MAQEIEANEEARRIHQELEATRGALSEKLEALQDRMKDTVDTTRETVEETMKSIKDSVQDTLHSFKQMFDIKHQTQKHPLCMLSGSVFLGVFLAHLTQRRTSHTNGNAAMHSGGDPVSSWSGAASSRQRTEPDPESSAGPSLKQRLSSQFHDELSKVQRLAIGVGAGIFRDWIKKAMPSIAAKLEEVIDSATSKMGGEPVHGPVLRQGHNGHGEHDD